MAGSDGGGWDVFLAYGSPDEGRARELHAALGASGVSVCFDREALRPGDDWHQLLPRYLREARVVVALVSAHTAEAHYARSEIIVAIEQVRREGGRLIPVRLDAHAEMPYGTEQLQAVEMFDTAAVGAVAARIADVVRNPASMPPLSATQVFCERVPAPLRFFAGRDALLAAIGGRLDGEGAATVLTQAISGMGGIGKTTVAAALADAHRHELDIVWWVRAERPAVLVADLAELAGRLGLRAGGDDDLAALAGALRRWLETTERRWLLVFDNAPDEDAVEPWRPRRGPGSVIVTSRNRNFGRLGEVVEVTTFPPDVAERFLRDRVRPRNPAAAEGDGADDDDVGAVVERLDGLPLALEQAAAWVERVPNRTFAHYTRLFDAAATDPFPEGTRPLGYELTATTAWRVSIAAAATEAPLAGRLLAALAFLAPDELPCPWLRDQAEHPYLGDLYAGGADVDAGLDALHGYSLARITAEDTISVHRVVQAVTRRTAPPDAAGFAVDLLSTQLPEDVEAPASQPTMATLASHALALPSSTAHLSPTAHDDLAGPIDEELCAVLGAVVAHQIHTGPPDIALATAATIAELVGDRLGPDRPGTMTSRKNLADAAMEASDVRRAVPIYEAVLADRERVLGTDHPDTLQSRSDLAHAYAAAGDVPRGLAMFEATLADRERVLGTDHPDTLESRHRVALVHSVSGDHRTARRLWEATLADRERVLGSDHPNTVSTRSNLATALIEGGSTEEGIALLQAVLATQERQRGSDNAYTLLARLNLAQAHGHAGDGARAIELLEAVVADYERVLGPDHIEAISSRRSLAGAYVDAGQPARAIPLLEEAVEACTRIAGDDHPATHNSRRELFLARATASLTSTGHDPRRGLGARRPTFAEAVADRQQATASARLTAVAVLVLVLTISANPDAAIGPAGDPVGAAALAVPAALGVLAIGLLCARRGWFRLLHGLVYVTARGWMLGALVGLPAALLTGHTGMMPALALHFVAGFVVFTVLQHLRATRASPW